MKARIFQPSRTAMQSGKGAQLWILEVEPEVCKNVDPLLGWVGSADTAQQVRVEFNTLALALDYAKTHGIHVEVSTTAPLGQTIRPLGYGGNFTTKRRESWTH